MSCGVAVIATRVGGNPELVVDGETGALFAAGNEAELTALLCRYAAEPDLSARHGAAGRQRVLERLSLSAMVKGYEAVYARVSR